MPLLLPPFHLMDRQNDPPGRHHVIANHVDGRLVYSLISNHKGNKWWLTATTYEREGDHKLPGYNREGRSAWRAAGTLSTSSTAKAERWRAAVETGDIAVGKDGDDFGSEEGTMAKSREEILSEYQADTRMGETFITSPGKFEREPIYVVALWDAALEQGQDEEVDNDVSDESPIYVFFIDANDRKEFPELNNIEVVTVWETSNGFIHHKWFPSKIAYEKAKKNHEAALERDHGPHETDDDGDDDGEEESDFEGHAPKYKERARGHRPRYNRKGWVLCRCTRCGRLNYVEPHGTTAKCACSTKEWTEHKNLPFEPGD